MFKKYYFIINPAAGKGEKLSFLPNIQSFCKENKLAFETILTKKPKDATYLAKKAAEKFEVIVAVGGDGTVNEVVNGIVETPCVLGIIPTGSGNDFSAMLGLTKNLKKDLAILIKGNVKKIDLGKVNNQTYFVNGMGVGFDGEVASRVRGFLKYSSGFLAYLLAVLRTLATYKFHKVKVTLDSTQLEQEIFLVATCIGTTYGAGFKVAPSAKIDDGLFTVCLVDKTGRFYALRNLPKFKKGTHLSLPEVHTFTSKRVIIESEDDLTSHIDGEILPLSKKFVIEILPQRLPVISALS